MKRLNETGLANSQTVRLLNNPLEVREQLIKLTNRTAGDAQEKAIGIVNEILNKVKADGDKALIEYTEAFDGFTPQPLQLDREALIEAWEKTPKPLQNALELAHSRIKDFHQKQIPADIKLKGCDGEILGRRWSPVQKAGIYIPGGRASYPSSVLMNAIPAAVAGVKEIVMVSPAGQDGKINTIVLAAAYLANVNKVFRIGGAQAIAALAFGTETVPRVDVISGPGNIYVTLAKKSVYGKVGIDSLAGPSEVLIIADHTAKSKQVAVDLLAQAEHDPLAATVLLTTEYSLAEAVISEIKHQLKDHPRSEICIKSLKDWSLIAVCENLDSCVELSNLFAPEHLELLVESPNQIVDKINNAGAIFIGEWSPEAVGDYLAGPNHTLPTSGTARFCGALCVETFMKSTSLIEFNETAFKNTYEAVIELARSEGLHSHSESIIIRTNQK